MRATVEILAQMLGQPLSEDDIPSDGKGESHVRALTLLSEFGMLWKTLHHSYHGVMPSVAAVVEYLTAYRGGQREPVRLNRVAPDELRSIVFNSNLMSAAATFKRQTSKATNGIGEMLTPDSPGWSDLLAKLKKSKLRKLASSITDISEDRTLALLSHGEFLIFLGKLNDFTAEPDWNPDHVKFFIDSRPLLDEKFHEVIRRADSVILQMLECFTEITNHYYRREV